MMSVALETELPPKFNAHLITQDPNQLPPKLRILKLKIESWFN